MDNLTISRLDRAISNVLGEDTYEALKDNAGIGRPRMHDMAIVKAFANDLRDEDTDVLRAAYKELSKRGFYPKEMWDVEIANG